MVRTGGEAMKPVEMTIKHDPAQGKTGDCFRCCIASLLELRAEDVPHFMDPYDATDGKWYVDLIAWLAKRGLSYLEFNVPAEIHGNWFSGIAQGGFDCYHLLSGISPRARHTVVARNGVMVHDPAPQKTGLIGPYIDGDQDRKSVV